MDIKAIPGKIQESDAETIIINLFEAPAPDKPQPGGATKVVDGALDGAISDLIEVGDLSGKAGQTAVLYPRGAIPARRVIVVGLGSRDKFDADPMETVRRAAAQAIRKARKLKASRVASILHGGGGGGSGRPRGGRCQHGGGGSSRLQPGGFSGVRLDLNEPLAYCLALTGLWVYERGNLAMAVVSFALAGLTKEVALAFPLALVAWEALERRWPTALTILIGSLTPYFIWAGVVAAWQGVSPFSYQLARPIPIPFAGFVHLEGFESQVMVLMWSVGPAMIAGTAALWQMLKTPLSKSSKDALLVLANVGVVATLPALTWVDPLAVLRLGVGSMIAIVLWLSTVRPRALYYAAGLWSPSLLMTFILPGFLL